MIKCKNECPTGKYDGCCFTCSIKAKCEEACDKIPSECNDSIIIDQDEQQGLAVFQAGQVAVLQAISDVVLQKKKLEAQEAELKVKLQEAMEKCGVKKFTSDILNITYIVATTATSVDSKKLKEKYPDIAAECSKTSSKKAYVKVEVKNGKG